MLFLLCWNLIYSNEMGNINGTFFISSQIFKIKTFALYLADQINTRQFYTIKTNKSENNRKCMQIVL